MNEQVLNVRLVNNNVLGSTNDEPGTPTVIGLLKQTYNKLNTSTGNTSLNLTILQNKVTSLENTVNGSELTNPPIEGLTARVSDLEDVTDDQSTAIQNNADNISLNASNIITERGRIDTLNTNLGNLSSALTDLTNRVTAVDKIDPNDVAHGRLKVVEDQVDHLETNVADLVAEVEGQGGALDDIIDLQADVTLLQQTVNGLHVGVGESTNQTGGERFNLYEQTRNEASGDYSHAEGYLTRATGSYSHVEGASNIASGEGSHAEGEQTIAAGVASHTEGFKTRASGNYAHAEGYTTNTNNYFAGGQGSHVEGFNTKTSNTACHAEGEYTLASGLYAHAEGYNTTASGSSSHAEGQFCQATNDASHAEGYYCQALGLHSHANGCYVYADSRDLTAVGKYNTYEENVRTTTKRLFVVGNGTEVTHRSDAFVVHKDGSVIINSTVANTSPSLTIGTSKAITATTASSSSSNSDDAIIATKYYVDNYFSGYNSDFVEISILFQRQGASDTSGIWYTIDTLVLKANIQTLPNNYKLINGVAYNTGTGTYNLTQGDLLSINTRFTINGTNYYFQPPSSMENGSFILNLPVSQLIFGYFSFGVGTRTYWLFQRDSTYEVTSNMSFTGSKKVWLQIINLYGTFLPFE